jgi:hypothetical protein
MYTRDLFKKGVFVVSSSNDYKNYRQELVGYVAKETEDLIVVFSEFDKELRFDVPKSEIAVAGDSVIIEDTGTLEKYSTKRDAPLPQGKSLRPSVEEISGKTTSAAGVQEEQTSVQETKRITATMYSKSPVQPTIGMGASLIATDTAVSKPSASDFKSQESDSSLLQASSKEAAGERNEQVSKEPEAVPSRKSEKTLSTNEGDQSQIEGATESPEQAGLAEDEAVFAAESKPELTDKTIESSSLTDNKAHPQGVDELDVRPLVKTSNLTELQDSYETSAEPEKITSTELNVDHVDPLTTHMTLWQDYISFSMQLYSEVTRQFAKMNEYWFTTYWRTWRNF